jgi:uroporphyrin-III C-methyltransferase
MGVGKLPEYAAALREAGLADDTPVALVERATWPEMRVATGTLGDAVGVRDRAGIEPPAITVIGAVAATRDRVRAFLRGGGADAVADATDDAAVGEDER